MNYLCGKPVEIPKISSAATISYPTLVTASWCPFTSPAVSFWEETVDSAGLSLNVIYADREEAAKTLGYINIAGVPCLIADPEALFYGLQITHTEAVSFLKSVQ